MKNALNRIVILLGVAGVVLPRMSRAEEKEAVAALPSTTPIMEAGSTYWGGRSILGISTCAKTALSSR
jgi:hypothetical protein